MIQNQLFHFAADLLKKRSGITLTTDKIYLLESRLQPVARQHGYDGPEAMLGQLSKRLDETILHDIVQAMTTNETMFFRDHRPYERFVDTILPLVKERQPQRKHLRIWSAACSTGQEPYTLAICLKENDAKFSDYRFDILASDLCESAVEKGKKGVFSQFEVQRGMPIQLLVKYFDQKEGNQWQIKNSIREQVEFKVHNLLDSPALFGPFDIIFCRNVLIYFDTTVKQRVVNHLTSALRPSGAIFLGSAESLIGISSDLKPVPSVSGAYTLKG